MDVIGITVIAICSINKAATRPTSLMVVCAGTTIAWVISHCSIELGLAGPRCPVKMVPRQLSDSDAMRLIPEQISNVTLTEAGAAATAYWRPSSQVR
jgi:hypothetical protein